METFGQDVRNLKGIEAARFFFFFANFYNRYKAGLYLLNMLITNHYNPNSDIVVDRVILDDLFA